MLLLFEFRSIFSFHPQLFQSHFHHLFVFFFPSKGPRLLFHEFFCFGRIYWCLGGGEDGGDNDDSEKGDCDDDGGGEDEEDRGG